jgi:hypothetical protein
MALAHAIRVNQMGETCVFPLITRPKTMNHHPLATFGKIAALACACWLSSPGKAAELTDDGYEVLTRGPVHEAFAGTVTYDPEPGIIIDTAPPAAIEELPPEHQLEGENVVWIPGYWAWDEEQSSFIWVSGIWRNLPPGREWVPGYWNPVTDDRYQWISGYWADSALNEVSYLPAPPRSIESGPSIAADSTDQLWLPGSWVYQQNNYAWRSGYWSAPRENWVYIPATYIWTPRGYIFVDGYWDYDIPRRGVVFAPVYFNRPVYATAGYRYSPSLVISLALFTDHLFLRPSYRHYYFGDYYASGYRNRGYYSCFNYHNSRRGYEPVYAYNRWSHRNDRNWERDYRSRYDNLRDRESARPPRTWAAMQSRPEYRDRSRALATPIDRYASNRDEAGGQRFRNVDRPSRERIATQTREVRNFRDERQISEGRAGRTAQAPERAMNVERSRSPIASRERATGSETSRVRPDARTPGRTAPPAVEPSAREPDRPTREADRPTREAERPSRDSDRSGPPSARPAPTERDSGPDRVSPPTRETETPKAVPQPRRAEETRPAQKPTRVQPPQRTEPTPQRVQPSQRTEPTPQRVQPPQRPQQTPQRVQPSQRTEPTPQRVAPPQRPQPTPQRVAPTQRQQPTPQRVAPAQRQQPTPQRVAPTPRPQPTPQRVAPTPRQQPTPQRVAPTRRQQPTPQRVAPTPRPQPTPQRVAPTQRQQPTPQRVAPAPRPQPTPQRVQPERGESSGGEERGNRRGR